MLEIKDGEVSHDYNTYDWDDMQNKYIESLEGSYGEEEAYGFPVTAQEVFDTLSATDKRCYTNDFIDCFYNEIDGFYISKDDAEMLEAEIEGEISIIESEIEDNEDLIEEQNDLIEIYEGDDAKEELSVAQRNDAIEKIIAEAEGRVEVFKKNKEIYEEFKNNL